MQASLIVFALAAILTASAAAWALRAYARAEGGAKTQPGPALAACALTAAAALGLYLLVGRPDMPDAPYAARLEALSARDPADLSPDELLGVLGRAAREQPNDPEPHYYTGQVLAGLGRPEEAARAFDAALRRDPNFLPAQLDLARALVQVEGVISPDALRLFQQVAAAEPDNPLPWFYQALAATEAGDVENARRLWRAAHERFPEDDPRRAMTLRMSEDPLGARASAEGE